MSRGHDTLDVIDWHAEPPVIPEPPSRPVVVALTLLALLAALAGLAVAVVWWHPWT